MKLYELKQTQFISTSIDEAWKFFSNPKNLDTITPDFLKFKITSDTEGKMYEGQIITYDIEVLPYIHQTWVTEIKAVKHQKLFVDEQRFGPYKMWHHKHIFEEVKGGVKIMDIVHYVMPFGILGRIAHALFVRKRLHKIFTYRYNWLEEFYNTKKLKNEDKK
jgi:ligand-binding SRPBCC domain-containing protein